MCLPLQLEKKKTSFINHCQYTPSMKLCLCKQTYTHAHVTCNMWAQRAAGIQHWGALEGTFRAGSGPDNEGGWRGRMVVLHPSLLPGHQSKSSLFFLGPCLPRVQTGNLQVTKVTHQSKQK